MNRAGDVIREARSRRGLSQGELARRAGTTQTYVSRIERGSVSPSFGTVQRLVHATGHKLDVALSPLPSGNVPVEQLRRDLTGLTPAERVEQAVELSEFLTGVAAAAPASR